MFANYQASEAKLAVDSPNAANLIILGLLLFLTLITLRRRGPGAFMDREQTGQLKGLAILMVVLTHLWTHVSKAGPSLSLGQGAVTLFFVLSGFGLTLSSRKRKPTAGVFLRRRVKRVMLPYWAVTVALLVLDYFILRRTYPLEHLAATFAGINITPVTWRIDYVRWFITLLLVWYALFFVVTRLTWPSKSRAAWILLGCAVVLFPVEYYLTRFGWGKIFAFPLGCLLAAYHERLSAIMRRKKTMLVAAAVLLASGVLYYLVLHRALPGRLPSIGCALVADFNSLILSAGAICLIAAMSAGGFRSGFLAFTGGVAYELFLLHGAFLIKYNPVFPLMSPQLVPISFILLLGLLLGVSYAVHRAVSA